MPVQANGIPWPLSSALGTVLLCAQSLERKKNHTCCCSYNYIFQGSAYENTSAVISRWTWQYFRYLNGASDGKSMALFKMTAILCCCPSWKTNPFPNVYVWAEKMKSFSLSRGSTRCWGQQRINLGGSIALFYDRSLDFCLSCWNLYFVCICGL